MALCVVVGILIGTFYANHFSGNRLNIINSGSNRLSNLLHIVDDQYVDKVNIDSLVDMAIPQILADLDPHSVYIPAKDAQAVTDDLKGSFSGVGIEFSFGLLDMAYYTKKEEFKDDIIPFEKKAWEKAMIMKQLPNTCMTTQFSHIMAGGYAAGYYSYKWAEVLDADAFSVFKKNGIFDQATAQSFRDNILSKGGTEHPMTLYKRFRGQEPTIDALLERNGIKRN